MRKTALLGLSAVGGLVLAAAACGSSNGSGTGAGTNSSSSSGSTSSSGGGGSSSSSSSSGTGGMTTSSSSSTSSSSGTGGAAPAPARVVISEVASGPAAAEFIEIYNPGTAAVDLSHVYLSDNAVYYGIAAGTAWNPPTSNPGTDFLVQFPPGTMIGAGAVLTIAANKTFEATYMKCPDLILDTAPYTCTSGTAKAMVVPTNGGLDATKQGTLLSDTREMLILFFWDGKSSTVKDMDYVTWGATFDAGQTRVDKTGVTGYVADTAAASQKPAAAPGSGQSIERCIVETGEKTTGGNGLDGHDETSEPMDANFTVQTKPTPGVKNACLP